MANHSSILAWKFQGQRSLMGDSPWVLRVRHDRVTDTILYYRHRLARGPTPGVCIHFHTFLQSKKY